MNYWDYFTDLWTSPTLAAIGIVLLGVLVMGGGIFLVIASFGALTVYEEPISLRLIVFILAFTIGISILLFGIPFVTYLGESIFNNA